VHPRGGGERRQQADERLTLALRKLHQLFATGRIGEAIAIGIPQRGLSSAGATPS
jgi:hypothetical protein